MARFVTDIQDYLIDNFASINSANSNTDSFNDELAGTQVVVYQGAPGGPNINGVYNSDITIAVYGDETTAHDLARSILDHLREKRVLQTDNYRVANLIASAEVERTGLIKGHVVEYRMSITFIYVTT